MIREKDVDLSSIYDPKKKRGDLYRRIRNIEKNKSDLYLSIHLNWYKNENYRGAEILYNNINEKNKILANSIMNQFKKTIGTNRKIKTTNLYLYRNTKTPGVLIECAFLSNYKDRQLIKSKQGQDQIAKTITNGVINYAKDKNKPKFLD